MATGRDKMEQDQKLADEVFQIRQQVGLEIAKQVIGQEKAVEQLLVALFAGGHALLVGVPGLAKTTLIGALAQCLDLSFARIQFTPDLMPSDVTGTEILQEDKSTGSRAFRFVQGPVFTNLLLADEVNRAPPKTQSALLEAMQERHVTIAGETRKLPDPFVVFATQNPIEQEGTYRLPEAQLDRFMLAIRMDYPDLDQELDVVRATTGPISTKINKVLDPKKIIEIQELVRRVPCPDFVFREAVEIVRATRPTSSSKWPKIQKYVRWGAGPRAAQHLVLAAKALTLLRGEYTATSDAVKEMATLVLAHRIVLNFHAESERISERDLITNLIEGRR